jgi:transposase
MRFVPTKTPEQQSGLVLHRSRHLFIRQQTAVINAIRAHLAEFGIVAPVKASSGNGSCVISWHSELNCGGSKRQILEFDRLIRAWHRTNEITLAEQAPLA